MQFIKPMMFCLLIFACGCGGYTDPSQQFKDSYIVCEASQKGELGTVNEFIKGLGTMQLTNGKPPEIQGWTREDNIYTLHFTMGTQEMLASFEHVLGGPELRSEDIGNIAYLHYISDEHGLEKTGSAEAATLIALAISALEQSGVATSAQKFQEEQEKIEKMELEAIRQSERQLALENEANQQRQADFEDYLFAVRNRVPEKISAMIDDLIESDKITTKNEVENFIKENTELIEETQQIDAFLDNLSKGDLFHPMYSGTPLLEAIRSARVKCFNSELNTLDEVKAYLRSKGWNPEQDELESNLMQFWFDLDSYQYYTKDLRTKIESGEINSMEKARSYVVSIGVNINEFDLLMYLVRLPKNGLEEKLRSSALYKIKKGEINSQSELMDFLQKNGYESDAR